MTVFTYWVRGAAQDIFAETVLWNWIEHWRPVMMQKSVERLVAIIERHCPFKPDLAYMPVPRCDHCAHWTPSTEAGHCRVNLISTTASFGCVKWEAK